MKRRHAPIVGGALELNVLCGIFQRSPYQCVPVK